MIVNYNITRKIIKYTITTDGKQLIITAAIKKVNFNKIVGQNITMEKNSLNTTLQRK